MKDKYKNVTIMLLLCIPLLVGLFFVDSWIFPQKTVTDEITSYSKVFVNNNNQFSRGRIFIGYIFYTQNGFEFSTEKTYIDENKVTLTHSPIFKNVNSVQTENNDYTDKLISGVNGASFYFALGLTLSAIISVCLLAFPKNLSENGFQNIILLNSFLLIITIYLMVLYN